MPDVIRSVLFVDFDNVFFSLQSADKAAAKSFADDPKRWLDAIESGALIENMPGAPFEGRRRILMRRCYANPAVMRYFRSYFTRSGFQIVDCPPLTGRGKNSADIYMVVDMLDALKHETRFDEFIILSGDADFTPVLLRLRAYDRSSIIYSNAVTAAAYKSLCDGMITEERLIDLTSLESDPDDVHIGNPAVTPDTGHGSGPGAYTQAQVNWPSSAIAAGRAPERVPDRPNERRPLPDRPNPDRPGPDRRRAAPKTAPDYPETAALVDQLGRPLRIAPEFAALARRVNAATNVPMFASDIYAALFKAVAADVRDNGFSFNRTVNAVIRQLAEAGLRLRPQHVAFVVKGLMLSGHEFVETDTPAALAKGFRRQVLYLCASEDMNLSETERSAIGMWILGGLKTLSDSEIMASDPITSDASVAAEVAGIDPDREREEELQRAAEDGTVEFGETDFTARSDDGIDVHDSPSGISATTEGSAVSDGSSLSFQSKPTPDINGLLARIRSSGR